MRADRRKPLGAAGEALAASHLTGEGYAVLEKNWRCRLGEIDIIAAKDGMLVFVEVRTRSAASLGSFGTPLESITLRKRLTIRHCAQLYVQRHPEQPGRIRFDCIGVVLAGDGTPVRFEHVQDAF